MSSPSYKIILETDHFVAVDKPSGLLTIPDREQSEISLKSLLLKKYGSIYTVHRLDKDTSGLLIFAKNEVAHQYFSRLFEERKVDKYYLGIVHGQPQPESGLIDAPIAEHLTQKGMMCVHRNGKASSTGYETLEAGKFFSLVSFRLYTGRTHQIRVHCKNIGHPLACDPMYGDGKPILISTFKKNYKLSKSEEEERPMISRLALHSYRLVFTDQEGVLQDLCSEIPKPFQALMKQQGKR